MDRVLVAGVGNIFLGDDAFGVEVVRRLARRGHKDGVDVVDFGTRGIDLAFTLERRNYETVILVDACPRGKAPGTLFVLEPGEGSPLPPALADAHGLDPAKVIAWATRTGSRPPRLRIVGCEPGGAGDYEEMCAGLSPAVLAAVEPAIDLVDRLIEEALCTSSP